MSAKEARLSVRINHDEYAALRRVAAADDRTPAAVVRRLVRRHLAGYEESSARQSVAGAERSTSVTERSGDAGAS